MARRFTLPQQVRLDATGAGVAIITARESMVVGHTRVTVAPLPGQSGPINRPRAVLFVDGTEFEDTYSGHRDATGSAYDLDAGGVVECRWTGGDAGALATLIIRGTPA